ncbi:hypothetical protein, partial [Blautia wexlerae]|uniref:hypothetical protein n=1 Tax=Blautia wexlerae TaxID=418240 RepID=UPI001C021538
SPVSGGLGYSVFVILHHNWILSAFLFFPDNSFLRFCCFSTTHGYILAHIVPKVNICFPLGKKFARLTHHG